MQSVPSHNWQAGARAVLDALLPPRCVSCGADTAAQTGVCTSCWSNIHFLSDPACSKCGHPFPYDVGADTWCAGCMAEEPPFDRAFSVMAYDDASRKLITRYKYGDRTQTTALYARWMLARIAPVLDEVDVICPVPLHRFRMVVRRYNQSALLADKLGKLSNKAVAQKMLHRSKHTAPQASLARMARLSNVKGCFDVRKPARAVGKTILLVDDVTTTGATLNECVRMLKQAGAHKIFVLTLAKAIDEAAL